MRTDAGYLTVIQHHYLFGAHNRADPLGDNQHRGISCLFFQGLPESRIGLKIESRQTVIENINLRFLGQRAGNRQSLLLPAGQVSAALGYQRVITLFACP